jgi:hypothetical protein
VQFGLNQWRKHFYIFKQGTIFCEVEKMTRQRLQKWWHYNMQPFTGFRSCTRICRFLVLGNLFRLETCMNSLVKVLPYYIYIYFFLSINWTLRMSDNLPERVKILGHVHIICVTVLENRIFCCQIFCCTYKPKKNQSIDKISWKITLPGKSIYLLLHTSNKLNLEIVSLMKCQITNSHAYWPTWSIHNYSPTCIQQSP